MIEAKGIRDLKGGMRVAVPDEVGGGDGVALESDVEAERAEEIGARVREFEVIDNRVIKRHNRAILSCWKREKDFPSALEISSAFRNLNFNDPIKYDFSLTRLGIRKILGYSEL